MDMVERMGDVIQEAWDKADTLPPIDMTPYERRRIARAALEAMREPTDAMKAAGCLGLNNSGVDDVEDRDADWCWQAMITQALKDDRSTGMGGEW
jgi:hypothetical protein